MKNIDSSIMKAAQKRWIAEAKYNTIKICVIAFLICTTIIILTLCQK